MSAPAAAAYDVAIIGAGISGLSAAILLLQQRPGTRVVILEREADASGRGAEATPELAAFFLGRTLGLGAHLNECHFHRHGARLWFTNGDPRQAFDASSEIGGKYLGRLPAYLIDRPLLDAAMLRRAIALRAECRLPVTVQRVDLNPGGEQTVVLSSDETIRARWVIDASGSAALLARQEGWRQPNVANPLQAVWGRFRGVGDWDASALRKRYPAWGGAEYGMRNPAVNYLMGDNWWSSWAPVRGGEVHVTVIGNGKMPESAAAIRAFLETRHPVARELLATAVLVGGSDGDRADLSFQCDRIAGDGYVMVGGAAGFLDPLYNSRLDWMAHTVSAAVDLIEGRHDATTVNGDFRASYAGWFDALYRDKAAYWGEFDLMSIAYLFDLGLYHLGVARPYMEGGTPLGRPPFADPTWTRAILRLVNYRCASLARGRRARGELGRSNAGRRTLFASFNFNLASAAPLLGALRRWAWLELTEGWRAAP